MFEVTRIPLSEDKETRELIMEVYHSLEHKEFFAVEENFPLEGEGYIYKAKHKETGRIASVFILIYPGLREDNLGYDIQLPLEELSKVALCDVAATRPEFRGHHLQQILMKEAENDARKAGYKYLMCTIHPDNKPSLCNAFALGYNIIMTKKKYGGLTRHILKKDIL